MCGRFSLGSTSAAISHFFGFAQQLPLPPQWNIAPGQNILTVRAEDQDTRSPALLLWGLIPPWAKDRSIGYKMINARAETVAEKPSFRSAFQVRRCLIAADGFYEWQRSGRQKQPYHIRKTDRGLFAFAGIWESWTDQQTRPPVESCAILTTEANDLMRPIHTRMPVILAEEDHERWLHDEPQNLAALLVPHAWPDFEAVPVSDYVNNARHEGVRCIEPAG